MTPLHVAAAFASVLVLAGASSAPVGTTGTARLVKDYAAALDRVEQSRGRASLETLYAAGMRAADTLQYVLEGFDDSTYARVQRTMRGFALVREEVVGASPDLDFFASLARSRGDAADTAFFHALRVTSQPGGAFPIYVEQQTDYSGCTDFGSSRLVNAFDAWRTFITRHPGRYAPWANDELRQIEDDLTTSTCACGDRASVITELRGFLKRFPNAPVAPRVRERLETVEAKADSIRYGCVSG